MDAKETLREFYRERSMHKRAIARAQRERFEALLPRIVEGILERDPQVSRIVLFGSLAEGRTGSSGILILPWKVRTSSK
jgi:hypothetical protein